MFANSGNQSLESLSSGARSLREIVTPRRQFLSSTACGFGSLALAALMAQRSSGAESTLKSNPQHSKSGHGIPRAKRVIFMFMNGGPSQMETFDYKPRLNAEDGRPVPFNRDGKFEQIGIQSMRLFGSEWKFRQHGESGQWISELLPHLADRADDLCVLNGMETDNLAHAPACHQLHTGVTNFVRPSLGAWVVYGLGTFNQNLPGFMTISPALSGDGGSRAHFGNAFLPTMCQATPVNLSNKPGAQPEIKNLRSTSLPASLRRQQLDLIQSMNREHLEGLVADQEMEGVIESFELAFRMQAAAPDLLDLSSETKATQALYGIGEKGTDYFGRQCLLARRLAEAGVRFIQVNSGGWDHHARIRERLPQNCHSVDKPIAGLIRDLKTRGLFDETLLVWSGEFGRTPYEQDLRGTADRDIYGRGHNPHGFSAFLAGGGVRGGMRYGETDEYGYRSVDGKVHIHDLHATILHLLGLDHEKLTYRHGGQDFRLTEVYGRVVREIL